MYEQIKNSIRLSVQSGELEPGQLLPSLRQLAAELRVSIITVTRAYNDLVAERLVVNEHGRGFVVLAIDPETARFALAERQAEAIAALVVAARAAHTPLEVVQKLIDKEWTRYGDQRD